MWYRVGGVVVVFGALLLLMGNTVNAGGKANTHTGTLVSVKGSEFTMKGAKGKEHTHTLADSGKVYGLDGKECKLSDLQKGQLIRVTTKSGDLQTATKVEAMKRRRGVD